jgi:hypothetical protein
MIFTKTTAMMELSKIINDFADALLALDSKYPIEGTFKPGIGPHTEDHSREMILQYFRSMPDIYGEYNSTSSIQYPGKREMCDIVIPEQWAIELKLLRPFGDNDKESEHWSNKLIHPYYGNKSAIGDALKLLSSSFQEKKAIILFSYEHTNPRIDTEITLKSFELILSQIHKINLKQRLIAERRGLVHPTFQVLKVIGWELD